MIILLYIYN